MDDRPTKYFSHIQESMIAKALGWSVVSGSGARAFHPGDVTSEVYLGECKTSEKETQRITIMKSHWYKICNEAMGVGKRPVLFVDNGTQTPDGTFCVMRGNRRDDCIESNVLQVSDKRASFKLDNMLKYMKDENPRYICKLFGETLIIMRLSLFAEHYADGMW